MGVWKHEKQGVITWLSGYPSKSIFTNCGNGWEYLGIHRRKRTWKTCRRKDPIFSLGNSRLLWLVVGGGSNWWQMKVATAVFHREDWVDRNTQRDISQDYVFSFKSFETDVFNFSSCRGGIDPIDIFKFEVSSLQDQPLEVCLWLKNGCWFGSGTGLSFVVFFVGLTSGTPINHGRYLQYQLFAHSYFLSYIAFFFGNV